MPLAKWWSELQVIFVQKSLEYKEIGGSEAEQSSAGLQKTILSNHC